MPDRPLPTVSDPEEALEAFLRHHKAALEGFRWEQEGPLSILVELEAQRVSGEVDFYLARFSFLYYPTWPASVTFVKPETRRYDPTYWPSATGTNIAFHATYGDAPNGMICNSMFFEYYFWGGHNPGEGIAWDPERHTFAASVNELRIHLRPPYYKGPRR